MSSSKCDPECTCGRHVGWAKKCPPGCTCGRHGNGGPSCSRLPDCQCGRHYHRNPRRKCPPDCQCGRHGARIGQHPCYSVWQGMIKRCFQQKNNSYKNYGGRGITVCEEWRDSASFLAYLDENLGPCPAGYQLDRIDVDGNYEPGNVRWASRAEQCANRRPRTPKIKLRRISAGVWAIR